MTTLQTILRDLQDGEEITFRRGDMTCGGFGVVVEITATIATGLARKPQVESRRRHGPGRHRQVGRTFCFDPDTGREEMLGEVLHYLRGSLQDCRKELEKEG